MHSSRVLGVVALGAIVVAAISFAVVDVTIADGCAANDCNAGIPLVAITFAALGALAALVSVVPAVGWIVETIRDARHVNPEHDRELARAARARRIQNDDLQLQSDDL
jgi:heme exporter protein D